MKLSPTTTQTPQEISVAERISQTIMRTTHASLSHSQLDDTNWTECILEAVFKAVPNNTITPKAKYYTHGGRMITNVRLYPRKPAFKMVDRTTVRFALAVVSTEP